MTRRAGRCGTAVAATVNWALLAIGFGLLRMPLVVANLCGIACAALINFSISKLWAWKHHHDTVAT